jgi:conjugal transfer ATP-binding protein TraC
MVVFNIRDLRKNSVTIAMYLILHLVWNEMRSEMKRRLVVVDEAWIMMQNDDAGELSFRYREARAEIITAGLTTITQDISDFMDRATANPS